MATQKTVLVTGVTGFVGQHLIRELKKQGHRVIGTGLGDAPTPAVREVIDEYIGDCDLANGASVKKLPLKSIDAVINLAGLSQMGLSFDNEEEYMRINVGVHTALAAQLIEQGLMSVRVLAISSGAVYDSHQPMPLTEASQLVDGGSPYSKSKIAMEKAMRSYRNQGLDVIIARPFNHIGPGQLEGFLVPDLTKQVMSGDSVTAGDLSTERDYTDVRDVVKAYILLVTTPDLKHDTYNVCSGVSISGKQVLKEITKAAGKTDITIKTDKSRIRPNDPKKVVGNNSRLVTDTGWRPTIGLSQTIKDVVAEVSS